MSESRTILIDSAQKAFAEAAESNTFASAWRVIGDAGFAALLIPEASGGFGADWGDAFAVFRLAGYACVPAPVGETALAARLCSDAALPFLDGAASLAPYADGAVSGNRFTGRLTRVPWGGDVSYVVAQLDGQLVRLNVADAEVERRTSVAGEPRDTLVFDKAACESASADNSVFAWGALLRTAQIAGAIDAALGLSIAHANERTQFGRPIAKFQALQQNLAVCAQQAASVNCAADAAFNAMARDTAAFEIAAGKLCANRAAAIGAEVAHQVHGAIGFTQEHGLSHITRRLTAWRSEFGNDRFWSRQLGAAVATAGADAFWPDLTQRSDGH